MSTALSSTSASVMFVSTILRATDAPIPISPPASEVASAVTFVVFSAVMLTAPLPAATLAPVWITAWLVSSTRFIAKAPAMPTSLSLAPAPEVAFAMNVCVLSPAVFINALTSTPVASIVLAGLIMASLIRSTALIATAAPIPTDATALLSASALASVSFKA